MRNQIRTIPVIILFAVAIAAPGLAWGINERTYDDATKKLVEKVKDGVERYTDRIHDKFKVEKISRNGVSVNVPDFMNDFKKSAETLKDRFTSNYAANNDLVDLMQRAKKTDEFMKSHQGQTGSDTEWLELRRNLVSLSSAYNIDFEGDPAAWKAARVTDTQVKNLASSLEGSLKTFEKGLDQASKKANVTADVRKDLDASRESLEKAVKKLKDAVGDKKPAADALDAVVKASTDLAAKLDSAGLTSAVTTSWSGFQKSLGSLESAFGAASQ